MKRAAFLEATLLDGRKVAFVVQNITSVVPEPAKEGDGAYINTVDGQSYNVLEPVEELLTRINTDLKLYIKEKKC